MPRKSDDPKIEYLTMRLTPETKAALETVQAFGPYALTKTAIAERGIILAIEELRRLKRGTE